jgi:ferrous iron transport protein B
VSVSHCDPGRRPDASAATAGATTVALLGRPNSGKSSLYNRLTGGHAQVGNFPGVTVEILEATVPLPGGATATVVDLPGVYSLDAAIDPDTDEGIARTFLDRVGAPLVLVQVVDATQLALGLRLTRELVRRPEPLLVVATQHDVLHAEGRTLDAAALSRALGVPVLAVSAREPAAREQVLAATAALLQEPPRHESERAPEWDPDTLAQQVVHERDDADALARRRRVRTARIDALLLHPVLGPVVFVGLMTALFAAVFIVADPVTSLIDAGMQRLGALITRVLGEGLLASFLTDGVLGGAGTVLAFLPQIVILTIAMELLEASGYLARGAFLIDRLLRAVGLGGRSFVPLLTAHACAVPAIAATRILRDPRERLTTMLVLPLMACSARIPTYGLLIATFFSGRSAWFKATLFVGLYFAGILAALIASLVLRRTATRGRSLPLVLEMPAYRAPEARTVARVAGRAASRFVRDVGTTILVASAVLWALLTVPVPGAPAVSASDAAPVRVERLQHSLAAAVGRTLEPVTRPLGFDWRINVGLIGSFGARELMVGTLGVIFGLEDANENPAPLSARIRDARNPDGQPAYGVATALALMAFFVLACQCMSTVAALRRETRSWRWPLFVLGYTYAAGYVAALLVYQGARLCGFA